MRAPPSHELNGGADERPTARRPASEPAPSGEALVEHLAGRLASVERELRTARLDSVEMAAARLVLARAARLVAEEAHVEIADLVRLALPALGHWCVVERLEQGRLTRDLVATEAAREAAAGALAGPVGGGHAASIALVRVRSSGRVERLDVMPDQPALDAAATRALNALGDGPVLLVPVESRGCLVAALAFGRVDGADGFGAGEQRLAEELAGFVALAIEQRAAADALEDATRARSEFLTMMSHELRTPLNAIAGYAQLLEMGLRGPLTEEQRDAVGRILRGQEHLLELVDAVLTFSRLTSGHLVLTTTEVAGASLMQMASDPLLRAFQDAGVALELAPCADDVRVLADRDRAPEIVRHLLANALKFTAPGGRVELRCECDADVVRLAVSDTGRGIPAGQLEAIFQPFVQADRGHARTADGSGLGLAIGRELAERMRGSLTATSEVGEGSRFVLTLRRAVGW